MQLQDVIARDYTLVGNGKWLRTLEHDSLVIDVEAQRFFWNSRNIYYGTIKDWFEKVKHQRYTDNFVNVVEEETPVDTPPVVPSPELVNLFYKYGKHNNDYWLNKRGYTEETIDKFRLGYNGEFYTIPVYENGNFVNFQCRKDNPKTVKHWYRGVGPHTFNFSILRQTDYVVITEGPVDCIMLRQNNIPAISQTSGSGDVRLFVKNFHHFYNIKNIFIVYDNDEAGNTGANKVGKVFGSRAKIYNMWDFTPKYDITDFFKDGNSKRDFLSLISAKSKEIISE